MSEVVSFIDYVPPARFDAVAWTAARIQEAATPGGPWTTIDTLSLTPDANPADPQPHSFTTHLGTAPDRWYRVIFVDAAANVSEPTSAVQNAAAATAGRPVCEDWITGADILDCCDATIGSDVPLDTFASEAVALLYELSGRRYAGICQRTVRPCPGNCGCWLLPRYGDIGWLGTTWNSVHTGCRPISTVKLAGYPVQEIVEVTIDGITVDPVGYRLDRHRDLVRLNDTDGRPRFWPGCQDLGVDSGAGTFFVTYRYGVAPPVAGVEAAKQLACELVKACPSSSGVAAECALPVGTVEVVRQGITVRAQTLGLFLASGQTGLAHVDAFLAVHGGRTPGQAVLWTPDLAGYAQEA